MVDLDELSINGYIEYITDNINILSKKDKIDCICKLTNELKEIMNYSLSNTESTVILNIHVSTAAWVVEDNLRSLYKYQKEAVHLQKEIINLIDILTKSLE